jgi:hypothetical protein
VWLRDGRHVDHSVERHASDHQRGRGDDRRHQRSGNDHDHNCGHHLTRFDYICGPVG